jgi:peptidoglycan/xylan/chitin deacetylase (PgdA/CDA1 family)
MHHKSMKLLSALAAAAAILAASLLAAGPTAAAAKSAYHNGTPNNTVCITIDDGYGYLNQKRLLDTLRKYNVKCTFFIIGDALRRTPNYWEQAIADGHDICYHTMYHKNLTTMTNSQIQRDIDQWNATIARVLPGYHSPKLARFPGNHGAADPRVMGIFINNGYQVIGWSVQDCSLNSRRNASHIKYAMRTNSILLIHFRSVDAAGLPRYIGWLKSHFTLAKVSEAYPDPTPPPQPTPEPTVEPTVEPTAEATTP